MNGKRSITPVGFVEDMGAHVCRCTELVVKGIATVVRSAASCISCSVAPLGRDTLQFLKGIAGKSENYVSSKKENTAETLSRFKRRSKMFGLGRAVSLQFKESRLAARRRGSIAGAVFDIAFPMASVAVLALTVNSVMSTDYGVSVEYDGEQVGVVSGEEVLGEAQCVVADRVKYYDTDGDYYVTATLAITPLSSSDDIIDENVLAEKMENRISLKYNEKPVEPVAEAEIQPDFIGDKVKAYAVRVDGEFIGAVEDYSAIEKTLESIKKPYDSGEYSEIVFDKEVEYDLEEYVDPDDIVTPASVLGTLTGLQSAPEYYEVQPGDNLWNIADNLGMPLDELCSCYATYNGKVIEDLENSILRVGTLIQIESQVPYLQVECKKEVTLRKELEFETITIEDETLPAGEIFVETEGKNGKQLSRAIVTYRDDVPVRKKTLDTIIVEQPVSKIVRVGVGSGIGRGVPEFITEGGSGDYYWPVDGGYISAHQGDGRGHKGIDIAAPYGTPIYAAAGGTIIDAGTGWNGGYGNCITIQNDDGNVTVYAHMAELAAEYGDYVEKGQLIGYVGSTGDSTGNHLHFEIRKDGKYYDPELYVSQE